MDEGVNPPETIHGRSNDAGDGRRIGDVHDVGDHRIAGVAGRDKRPEPLRGDINGHDPHAVLDGKPGRGPADAAGSTGDDDDAALEPEGRNRTSQVAACRQIR